MKARQYMATVSLIVALTGLSPVMAADAVGTSDGGRSAAPSGPVSAALGANFVLADYGYDQGWRVDKHPRFMVDITRDGRADIVGMGNAGVYTSIATGNGSFTPAQFVLADYGYDQGWRVGQHPRFLIDINADGRADIVGVRDNGVHTAVARGDGTFAPVQPGGGPFGTTPVAATKFLTADVNADGRTDLIRLLNAGTHPLRIATAQANGTFGTALTATTAYDFFNYDFNTFQMVDVTGDRRAEIIALQVVGPIRMVSSSPILDGTGRYTNPQPAGAAFPVGLPAPTVSLSSITDVTGDGRADLVAFGTSVSGTWVATSLGDGTFGAYQFASNDFGENFGWIPSRHPRLLADFTGDHNADIAGFGYAGVYSSMALGNGTFTTAQFVVPDFGYDQGWRVEQHPRFMSDITGDGRADIVGFGNPGIFTATSRGDGTFNIPTIVAVPDVRGNTVSGAASALQAVGLVLGQRRSVIDNTCNNIGLVVSQTPSRGTEVNQGTAVDVTIGQRPPNPCP